MRNLNKLLVSIDFRSHKGGISRVANLISESLEFDRIISLHGYEKGNSKVIYFNGNKVNFAFYLLKILFFNKPSLLVFDHLNLARILCLIPGFILNKIVIFLHDEEAWGKVKGLRQVALYKSKLLLCNSDFTKTKFLNSNPQFEEKTRLCNLGGVAPQFLSLENPQSIFDTWINDKRPYFLFVSRLWKVHRYKGYFELLEAYKMHYEKKTGAFLRLAIIGNGDDEESLNSFIVINKLSDHIKVFSKIGDKDLKKFYEGCSAFLFPSTREGFGLVLLEAMYFKKCCIGILGQPAEEIIIEGKTGLLLNNNKPKSLELILDDFENNPNKYFQMGQEGYSLYMNNFTNEHFKKRFLKSINE